MTLADEVLPARALDYDPDVYHSYAIDAAYDPGPYLRRLDIPLLFVFGGRDVNIPTQASVAYLGKLESDYRGTIDVRVYPQLGHPMATWRGLLHGGYPPDYLAFYGEWAQSQITR